MALLSIPTLDSDLAEKLRERAAQRGRSIEDEAIAILRAALEPTQRPGGNLAASIRARFTPVGGVELADPVREPMREPMDFGG
jgi:plasmid stability protein